MATDADAFTDKVGGVPTLPPGLTIDSVTGMISGTVNASDAGVYMVTITATDTGVAVATTDKFTWNVSDSTAPMLAYANQMANAGSMITPVNPTTFSDIDPNSVTDVVAGMTIASGGSSVTVGARGAIEFASGTLADPVVAGDYPLVDVTTGVARLRGGGRWILSGGPGPQPMIGAPMGGAAGGAPSAPSGGVSSPGTSSGGAPSGAASPAASSPSPGAPSPGAPSPIVCPRGAMCLVPSPCPSGEACATPVEPPAVVRIVTGVHLGLSWGWPADGSGDAWLLPVYVFEVDGGMTIPVLALPDGFLSPPASPPVQTIPGPLPAVQPGPKPLVTTTTSVAPA